MTQLQTVSASAAPEAGPRRSRPETLVCPAAEILDPAALRRDIRAAAAAAGPDAVDRRKAVVEVLRAAQSAGRAAIAEAFRANPFAARATTRAYAWLTDQLVGAAFDLAREVFHPAPTPTAQERLCLIAVGGYGRGEMAPYSDVDLLFLAPYKLTPWAETVIESMLYVLWDLKMKVGHASRTVKDCLRLAREDFTIRTSLVERRYIAGDADLSDELSQRLQDELFAGTVPEFIEAKLAERGARHRKQGGQRYMVEPNVKEGKGGLRDLQSLYWIGKYIHRVHDASELVRHGVFTQEEYDSFREAHDFLWAVRCHVHLLSGRATDQLTFDLQVEVAAAMGYRDRSGRRAVEVFMQDYFRHATEVGELTRIFLTAQEAAHLKTEPMLQRLLKRRRRARRPMRSSRTG